MILYYTRFGLIHRLTLVVFLSIKLGHHISLSFQPCRLNSPKISTATVPLIKKYTDPKHNDFQPSVDYLTTSFQYRNRYTSSSVFLKNDQWFDNEEIVQSKRNNLTKKNQRLLFSPSPMSINDNNEGMSNEDRDEDIFVSEADRLRKQAEILRQQIRDMEEKLDSQRTRPNNNANYISSSTSSNALESKKPLAGKRILVAGANGRVGSMVCRYLLRTYPAVKEVIAAVHVVGENSPTARGYGRLSYEVGAEDGIGTLPPAWSRNNNDNDDSIGETDSRTRGGATFQFDEAVMSGYNLNKLRVVECELLDPVQCQTICEDVDAVIFCATDFNGNTPRAVSGLNIAFLFRAIANPTKGRVEIEGLQNLLGALKLSKLDRMRAASFNRISSATSSTRSSGMGTDSYGIPDELSSSSSFETTDGVMKADDSIDFVLVSTVPEAFENYETPFGEFNAIKRQAENMMRQDFPSLNSIVLRMGRYDDTFIQEDLEIFYDGMTLDNSVKEKDVATSNINYKQRRLINRRDAARAAVDALLRPEWKGRNIEAYTAMR